jgi:hypothetical protein
LASAIAISTLFSSCESFVDLGAPPTQVVSQDVFKADATATSAVLGLYSIGNMTILCRQALFSCMSADDIQYNTVNASYDEFEKML